MISLYIRKVRNGHQYIIINDLCVKLAEGKIQGNYSWPMMLRIIANQSEMVVSKRRHNGTSAD